MLGRHRSRRSKIVSKGNKQDLPSKKNWIYNPSPPAVQTVPATPLAAPYSAAYYQPVFVRNSPQSSPVTSSTSYVQGNQRTFTNKPGTVNRGFNQQGTQNGVQEQVQNTRVKNINAVLRGQHLRRKVLREG